MSNNVVTITGHVPDEKQIEGMAKRTKEQLKETGKPLTYGIIDVSLTAQQELSGSAVWAASPLTDVCIDILNKLERAIKGEIEFGPHLQRNIRQNLKDALREHEDLIDILGGE